VAATVDGDTGSWEFFEVGAGLVGDAGVADGVAADDELKDSVVVEDGRGGWSVDVACGVMVCTKVMTSVIRTRAVRYCHITFP
jgi:hypothetical protein